MCGIFGVIGNHSSKRKSTDFIRLLNTVAQFSEARGKDSSGVALKYYKSNEIKVLKGALKVSELLRKEEYNSLFHQNEFKFIDNPFSAIGHARLTTNGTQLKDINNQPVVKNDCVLIHNGIIVNVEELWQKNPDLEREYDIDTEVFAALVRKYIISGSSLSKSVANAMKDCFGTISTAMMFSDSHQIILATNNGSLYYTKIGDECIVFASELFILQQTAEKMKGLFSSQPGIIQQLQANTMIIIDPSELLIKLYYLNEAAEHPFIFQKVHTASITVKTITNTRIQLDVLADLTTIAINPSAGEERKLLEYNVGRIGSIKRCTKCLLPETFPFIQFDSRGECSVCKNYKLKNQQKPFSELEKLLTPFRKKKNKIDCLIPFSGGRDSTYTLYFAKEVLELNPIAFTYDWGMVTDLARRNAARVCGKLGVENIIVAADIHSKRENIRKNILAWLKNPHLGMVPLFMAGDKYFFYYANMIQRQIGINLSIWGANPLENTDFKTGFTGIRPNYNKSRIDEINRLDKIKLALFFSKQYLVNPSYFNSSLIDTLGSFKSRYFTKRYGYFQLFDYVRWDEEEIESVILNKFDWEKSIDTTTTWRIGDGTASFYNYIYFTVAGFSEYDTFRSNQIREGVLSRKDALYKVNEENHPRYETIKWYLEILGLDFIDVIKAINKIPKLY